MQSFLLKSIICLLIINEKVNYSSASCYDPVCRLRCYHGHSITLSVGYCTNDGKCECKSPTIYIFDGVIGDLSQTYIDNSLKNNKIIQKSISIKSPDYRGDNTKNINIQVELKRAEKGHRPSKKTQTAFNPQQNGLKNEKKQNQEDKKNEDVSEYEYKRESKKKVTEEEESHNKISYEFEEFEVEVSDESPEEKVKISQPIKNNKPKKSSSSGK